jgi:RNA 3'-terminal phosphate cyclase (ATP)
MDNAETVYIDGSIGEGGGQILRTSLALACITGKSLHIENIRAARRNPGLAKQHISCVQDACQICNGNCDGDYPGSKVLDFKPGHVRSGDFYFDIGSAGSASLVLQTVLPPLFLADGPSTITVTGGTHNPLAPPFDFLNEDFLPAIANAGFHGNCRLLKHGFFPAGGGKIICNVQPWQRQANQIIDLCRPTEKLQIHARIYTSKLPVNIAERQRKLLLKTNLNIRDVEHIEVTDSDGPGNCVMVRLCSSDRTTVLTAYGMRGKPSEEVIEEVVNFTEDFLSSGAAVDRFLADQLLMYMAISKAGSYTTNELSNHLLTNVEIIKRFIPVDFHIHRQKHIHTISCEPA